MTDREQLLRWLKTLIVLRAKYAGGNPVRCPVCGLVAFRIHEHITDLHKDLSEMNEIIRLALGECDE